jgi:peptide/nickel transport system ATP-binding protein
VSEPLVTVGNLSVRFTGGDRPVDAVNGVDFELARGEVLGVLGESGSGKSVTLRALLRILPARRSRIGGAIRVAGRDVLALSDAELAQYRGGVTSMIFQEPMLAFDPVFTVGEQIAESVTRHQGVDRATARKRAIAMLERVRIPSPERRYDAYPHEMSGGMRQRAMIAIAMACTPTILIADEPTTALDVTIQAQILDLMQEMKQRTGAAVMLITHDLGVIAETAQRVIVMYAGRKVEEAPVDALFAHPRHPYTRGLMTSIPRLNRAAAASGPAHRLTEIPGVVPSLIGVTEGCTFAPRCPYASEQCRAAFPPEHEAAPGHIVACWNADALPEM